MRCYECGGTFVTNRGSLTLNDRVVGKYTVDNIEYKKCDSCGEFAFPAGVSSVIENAKKMRLNFLIGRLPISEFIAASEVASMLGISRQAVHKHRRISRGFIHSLKHGDRILYHKKSTELFRDNGDGRFSLITSDPGASWGVYRVIDGGKVKKPKVPHTWETQKIDPQDTQIESVG